MTTASLLVAAGAAVCIALGVAHLVYTFVVPKLGPRDPALEARMKEVSPVITRQTTMWKAWLGFNASHSASAILFGAVYGYLALARPDVLFGSAFLATLGGAFLAVYVALCRKYWFSGPLRWLVVASVLYAAGWIATLV